MQQFGKGTRKGFAPAPFLSLVTNAGPLGLGENFRGLHTLRPGTLQLVVLDPASAVSSMCREVDSSWVDLLVSITESSLAGVCLVPWALLKGCDTK